MPPLKISKKHHKHVNNPFPSPPKSLPLIHGTLSCNRILPHHKIYQIGENFRLLWSSNNGGYISICHKSQPCRSLWSSIPGEAFISAAAAKTEVEESRGSFVIKDGDISFLCDHQTIDEIKTICKSDIERKVKDCEFLHGLFQSNDKNVSFDLFKWSQFPTLVVSGWVSSKTGKRFASRSVCFWKGKFSIRRARKSSIAARYWVLFYQKNNYQVAFQVKFGELQQQQSPRAYQRFSEGFQCQRWKQVRLGRRRCFSCFSSLRNFRVLSSDDDEKAEEKVDEFNEFSRVFLTYSSERDEKFYGFGEQFSHMEFKGRRVPILVQEQGIGRGDQPITFAANLISYRSGGDWSTTYAPSPFYMTSKMRSFYLEGYNYSVFDLTEYDRVQIQVNGNCVAGRILNGSSPVEIIQRYTETIGRPPLLPNWIINGAVIGMQGGTEAVRRVWDQLKDHDVPVSSFWLQDWVGKRKTIIGSQLWWNWEVDTSHYAGWRELVDDFNANNIKVMAYCNPCLVPVVILH